MGYSGTSDATPYSGDKQYETDTRSVKEEVMLFTAQRRRTEVARALSYDEDTRQDLYAQESGLRRSIRDLSGPGYELEAVVLEAELMALSQRIDQVLVRRDLLTDPHFLEFFVTTTAALEDALREYARARQDPSCRAYLREFHLS